MEIPKASSLTARCPGQFRLELREDAIAAKSTPDRDLKPKALARLTRHAKGSLRKLRGMSLTKSKESSTERESSPAQSDSLESEPGYAAALTASTAAGPIAGSSGYSPACRALMRHQHEER